MKTWLQWVSKGPWYQDFDPPHPGQWVTVCTSHWALQLSWKSFSAEAWFSWLGQIKTKVAASQSLYWTLLLTEGVVSKQPPPYPTRFDLQAWSTHPLLARAVRGLSSCSDQDAKPLTCLDVGLAWSRAAPGAGQKPSDHVLTKSDRYWTQNDCRKTLARVVPPSTCPGR